ncbi:MAG: trehalose-phosphatase [Actinomycetota bacterium]|nr:trehalose-phosphatase [Actinomycetota bacterium]
MPLEPTTAAGRAGLAAVLADPTGALLALDFDGTLAPIVADPSQARAHPGAVDALAALAGRLGHLAVVTGRPAAVAARYAGLAGRRDLGDVEVLGQYGLERWDAETGQVTAPPASPAVAHVREQLGSVLAGAGAADAHVEDKGAAVAVHTRRMADPVAAFERLRGPLDALAREHGLHLEPGRFVLELRPRGVDKGGALRSLVQRCAARSVMFAGDDLGDLAAYDEVDRLRHQGLPGLLVCSSSTEQTALADRADLVVDGPAGVVGLLRDLAAAL